MSTLALRGGCSRPGSQPNAKPSLFAAPDAGSGAGRAASVHAFLTGQSDERLTGFGFTAADIEAIRARRG